MDLRRFRDIIAIKNDTGVSSSDTIVAFHASNMEVAEISQESFNEMIPIDALTGDVPNVLSNQSTDAYEALETWNNEANPDVKSGKIEFGIRSLTININQICNLKCNYCAAGGDGTYGEPTNQISIEKTIPQLKYFLGSIKPKSKFYISLVGGEPLLHPQAIKALYTYVKSEAALCDITPIIKIVTNGTLMTGTTLEILRSMKIHLTISIDGTKSKNDLVRPSKDGKSTTDKILRGLAELAENRGELLSINFSSITSNGNESLVENYLFLRKLNPDSMDFIFANDERSSTIQQSYIEQMNQIAAIAWENGGETELRKINTFNHYFKLLDSQQRVENHCGAGKNYLMVDAKNRLFSCVWDTNNRSDSVGTDNLLDYDKLSNYSKPLVELNNCHTCWARFMCGGGCMHINRSHTGDRHKKSLLFCERTRNLILTTLLYYKRARSANN